MIKKNQNLNFREKKIEKRVLETILSIEKFSNPLKYNLKIELRVPIFDDFRSSTTSDLLSHKIKFK